MNHQVLNIEQMQHLKELGLDTSKASMVLLYTDDEGEIIEWEDADEFPEKFVRLYDAETGDYDHSYRKCCGVFTSDDIQAILPKIIKPKDYFYCDTYYLYVDYQYNTVSYSYHIADEGLIEHKTFKIEEYGSLINTLYEALCWCIEQGYVETKKEE